jgi:hypothetical protein
VLTAKWRFLKKAMETNVNKAERIVRCICLLHYIIIDVEGTTRDHSVLQENSQIRGFRQTRTNVSGRSFSRSSKGAIDVRNAFKAYLTALLHLYHHRTGSIFCPECLFNVAPHNGTFVMYKIYK